MSVASIVGARGPAEEAAAADGTEAAEHLRTQFLRRVAHDIASPTGVSMTVLDELATSDRPRPELIAMAKRSLRRLMRLSEHLALVAELEAGELVPELAPTDLRVLAKKALDEAVSIDGRKDIVAVADLPDAPLLVAADGRLLQVVFREVIGNALKLAQSRVEVSLRAHDAHLVLRVEDDGPGFSAESAATLGRRFLKRTSARGLGLSLSMAVEILRSHGGTLDLEASMLPPGRRGTPGAAVVLKLPATSNDA